MSDWNSFGLAVNNAFYFVIDKIVDLMAFFREVAYDIGRIVLLIAILTAALNYVLTGSGLKENLIKILKATLFFFIIASAYPRIISWISWYTFELAQKSVYKPVKEHFDAVTKIVEQTFTAYTPAANRTEIIGGYGSGRRVNTSSYTYTTGVKITNDNEKLFSDLKEKRGPNTNIMKMEYTVVPPAALLKIVFFIAKECIGFADDQNKKLFPEFSRILKGLVCAGVIIFTGVFALLEYVVCFLEFMLVASVGIILLPMSIWEGSKFLSEGFIKSIIGFFMKLLFCNIAIFLLLYGFITLFYLIEAKNGTGFTGNVEQIIFIVFTCLLFFFICKSAPGVASGLLSGSPSLTGAGAVGAVAGAVGSAMAVGGMAKGAVSKAAGAGGAIVGGGVKAYGALAEAKSAARSAGVNGGGAGDKAAAFMKSLGRNASQGLARSIYGQQQSGGKSLGEINAERRLQGANTGYKHMHKV